jgi:hypothetical protein
VPVWFAPLVAPAVDLSILGLLLSSRHLVLAGVTSAQLRPARQPLIFTSVVTLALNVAEPLVAGEYGKTASTPWAVAADRLGSGRPGSAEGVDHRKSAGRSHARRREACAGPVRQRTDHYPTDNRTIEERCEARRHLGRQAGQSSSFSDVEGPAVVRMRDLHAVVVQAAERSATSRRRRLTSETAGGV